MIITALTLPKMLPWGKAKELADAYFGLPTPTKSQASIAKGLKSQLTKSCSGMHEQAYPGQGWHKELAHVYCMTLLLAHAKDIEVTLSSTDAAIFSEACDAYSVDMYYAHNVRSAIVVPSQQQEFIDMLLLLGVQLAVYINDATKETA